MSGALLNGQQSGRSSFDIPTGLKVSERVKELILIPKDIAGAQSHATIDALDGMVWASAEGMGSSKKAVCICEIGARFDGSTERTDGLRITPSPESDEATRKMSPGLLGITRARAICRCSGFREG
jgi:hypothetical protein